MSNTHKTYLLAPTLDTPPENAIVLGNIITDPRWPEDILNSAPLNVPNIQRSRKEGYREDNSKSRDHGGGLFAQFLQVVGIGPDVSGHYKTSHGDTLSMQTLETVYFNPTREFVTNAAQLPEVQDYANNRHVWSLRKPLYMITGLKIARGASVTKKALKERGIHAQVTVDFTALGGAPVNVGPKLDEETSVSNQSTFEKSDDFVLAYRLRKLKLHRSGEVESVQYTKSASYADKIPIKGDEIPIEGAEIPVEVEEIPFEREDDQQQAELELDDEYDADEPAAKAQAMEDGDGDTYRLVVLPDDA